jgi:hypothetical protein
MEEWGGDDGSSILELEFGVGMLYVIKFNFNCSMPTSSKGVQ